MTSSRRASRHAPVSIQRPEAGRTPSVKVLRLGASDTPLAGRHLPNVARERLGIAKGSGQPCIPIVRGHPARQRPLHTPVRTVPSMSTLARAAPRKAGALPEAPHAKYAQWTVNRLSSAARAGLGGGNGRHGSSQTHDQASDRQRRRREWTCKRPHRSPTQRLKQPKRLLSATLLPYFAASTFTRAFGASPNISGAYSASTRLGGSAKSPALFRRTVYCIVTVPLGRYS